MDNTEILLDAMQEAAQRGSFEAFEMFENQYDSLSGFNPRARAKIQQIRATRAKMTPSFGGAGMPRSAQIKPGTKAQFDIIVTGTNGGSAAVLTDADEYILFGAALLETGYTTLFGTRPAGVSWGSNNAAFAATAENVLITRSGATRQNITIASRGAIPYPALLRCLLTDAIKVTRMRVTTADTTAPGLRAISDQLSIGQIGVFGKSEINPLSMAAFKMPEQQQAGIIDVDLDLFIDKNFYIKGNLYPISTAASAAGNTLTFSFFVEFFQQFQAENVLGR